MKSPGEPEIALATGGLPDAAATKRAADWRAIALGAALVAMTLVAYLPALTADIHLYDDDLYIGDNVSLRSVGGLWRMWVIPGTTPQFYPLTFTTFWIEHHVWGADPLGYHAVNILLHAASAVLVWRVLLRLRMPGAWLAAAIFAVHPVCVESVAWAAERKNVLSLPLTLLSMLCYFRFAPPCEADGPAPRGERPRLYYGLALALFAAALLSKTAVAPLPAVLLVVYWWKHGRLAWRDVAPLVPFFGLAVALAIITVQVESQDMQGPWIRQKFSPVHRGLIAGRAVWFYAGKLAWPHPLIFFYPKWPISARTWWQYLFPAAALAAIVALWLARRRIGRGPLAAVLIFVGTLTPVLGFFDMSFTRCAFVADHFQYHAAIAMMALVAAGCALAAARLAAPRSACAAGMVVLLIALAALTLRQACIYHDRETLGADTLAKNPESWPAYANLAGARSLQGNRTEAIALLRHARRFNPNDPTILADIGSLLLNQGRRTGLSPEETQEMLDAFRRAASVAPQYAPAQTGLGLALLRTGRAAEALPHLAMAVKLAPNDATAVFGMGKALQSQNQPSEALAMYEAALRLKPDDPEVHQEMAAVLVGAGQFDDAMRHLDIAMRRDPTRAAVHYTMGRALAKQGQVDRAAGCYREALRLRPRYADAITGLGEVSLSQGHLDEAIARFDEALRIEPGLSAALDGMQKAMAQKLQEKSP